MSFGCLSVSAKRLFAGVVVGFLSSGAFAGSTFVWTGAAGDDDWTNKDNYEGQSSAPGAGDIVKVPDGVMATISSENAASWALASSLDRIAPQANGSRVVIYVAEGVTNDFNAGISLDATYRSKVGTIEKTGKGAVRLKKSSGDLYDYCGQEFWVREGLADFSSRTAQEYFGIVRIEAGAEFLMPRATTWMTDLKGEGSMRDPSDWALRVFGGTAAEPTVVEAKLASAALHYNCSGYTRILRTDNLAGTFSVYDGVTEFIVTSLRLGARPLFAIFSLRT